MSTETRRVAILFAAVLVLGVLGCATQPPPSTHDLPGFFTGLLYGFIMPFSLIGSLFWKVRVYAFPNAGGWYDLGFVIGACMIFGGGGKGASRSKRAKCTGCNTSDPR